MAVIDLPPVTVVRWIATVYYRAEAGIVDVQHDLRIEIVRADSADREMTVEQAALL